MSAHENLAAAGRLVPKTEQRIRAALRSANVEVNGEQPWDIRVSNRHFYRRVLRHGSLGLGESYVDGWWETRKLDEFIHRLLRARLEARQKIPASVRWSDALSSVFNFQSHAVAFRNGQHYELGNDLYQMMLDSRMVYTCGCWQNASTLDDAQEAKLDLICCKLGIRPGMKVLDIGCGWGSFARYASERYGATVTGITISREQAALGRQICAGFPIDIRLLDYRDVEGTYDRIVSLGMFEHVGWRNYRTFMRIVWERLHEDGMFLLHTIGGNESVNSMDPWIGRHIFPNAMLPSIAQIGRSVEGLFVMEDWENFGADYDRTLTAWFANFDANWPQLERVYGRRFYRMWKYYLLSSAGSFRARKNQVWQVVFSKKGLRGGYRPTFSRGGTTTSFRRRAIPMANQTRASS